MLYRGFNGSNVITELVKLIDEELKKDCIGGKTRRKRKYKRKTIRRRSIR